MKTEGSLKLRFKRLLADAPKIIRPMRRVNEIPIFFRGGSWVNWNCEQLFHPRFRFGIEPTHGYLGYDHVSAWPKTLRD
jgi:hypothetical protein